MGISNVHNLRSPPVESLRPYGLRVSLPSGDPMRKLLGPEWHKIHWYATPQERELFLSWVLTAKTHHDPAGWRQLYQEAGYTGDYHWTIIE